MKRVTPGKKAARTRRRTSSQASSAGVASAGSRGRAALPGGDFALLETFWKQPVARTVLPNGLTVLVQTDRSVALASVQVWVKTGSIHEGRQLGAGLSHYLEHMLFKGTARRSGREISATIQAHGGTINAYTTFDRTVYHVDLPSEHAGVALDVLADAVLASSLPADEVAREKDVILREIAMTRDDPDGRLWERLFATAFREHPYRDPVIGHRDVFAAVGRGDLHSYYKDRYVPNNMVVVVAGDVGADDALAMVVRHFGGAPRSRLAPVLVPQEPAQLAGRESHSVEDTEVTRAVMAWPIPGLSHADAPALDLLAMVLGSGESSVLWDEVREKAGLVHGIDASSWNPGTTGLFCISFVCEPARRAAAAEAIAASLGRRMRAGFPAGMIAKALRQLVVSEIGARRTVSGMAARLGAAEVVVGDLDHGRSYFARLSQIDSDELRDAMRRYLSSERRTFVSLGPAAGAAGGASAPAEARTLADFTETVLPNGARILLQPDSRLPNLHLRLALGGGSAAEEPGLRGAAALLGTMLTKDTRRRSAAEVARRIEAVGGAFFPSTGAETMGLGVEVLPPDAALGLDVLSEAVLQPRFVQGTFATERDAQVAAVRQDADDVVAFARRLLRRKFFGSSSLSVDVGGDVEGLNALAPAHLEAMHSRLFVAGNSVLAVAGDFDPGRLMPSLRRFMESLPLGGPAARAPAYEGPAEPGDFVVTQPREQAVVLQAFPGPARESPDFYVGEVADELFSSMASRLFERIREEKGLAYFVRSARVTSSRSALFGFMAGTQPGREAEVIAEIEAEVARVASGGVTQEEVLRCRARLKAGLRQGMQTHGARALRAAVDTLFGRPIDDWKQFDARIDAVGIGELAAFARTYFVRERRTQLVVRPQG